MKKPYRLSFRVDQGTYDWLESLGSDVGQSADLVARELVILNRMSKDTQAVYGRCLEYLNTLGEQEFLQGLDGLISALKEIQIKERISG
ncbi:hypothetical protein H6G81_18695 [Scytonema hofmannii FACHB-248]|uniref:CopG family transcriptional regulator n=1 Tax=Scytonema hofmannii FACHB-248 TaxID=1842502 RepID=A0ABR8GTF2_9CYAN|nr:MULTISPECIES: hypothetical protein [Nostocales]MBD2606502.1 hypothetical protein [Scytonema hofmannii FACHB-248]